MRYIDLEALLQRLEELVAEAEAIRDEVRIALEESDDLS